MDELIDILDSEGNLTDEIQLKSHAHRMGLFHATVHIWFYNTNGEILLQQRGANKRVFPLLWDVSVAGHIGAGENVEISAIREIQEEIGLTIEPTKLQKIAVFKSIQRHSEDLLDKEFHHTFICELKYPLTKLKKQASEVKALSLVSLEMFLKEITNTDTKVKYVPHTLAYYKTIFKAIKENL